MLILVDRNCYLLFILGIMFLMVVLTCAQKFDIQFSYLSSSNESQDRGLPPGTEHIYLNSEAVKKHISQLIWLLQQFIAYLAKKYNMQFSEHIYNYFKWVSENLVFEGSLLCSGRANSGEAEKRGANYVYKESIKGFEGIR